MITTLSALQEDTLLDSTGRTSAWWDNFINEVVLREEWRENFRMPRKSLLKLKLPNFESKQPPKTLYCGRRTFVPFSLSKLRFFKFNRHSVDEA